MTLIGTDYQKLVSRVDYIAIAEWPNDSWRHPGAAHILYRPHCGWRITDIPRQGSSARSIGVNDGIRCYRGTPSCHTRLSKQSPPGPIAASLSRDSATSSMNAGTLRIGRVLRLTARAGCLLGRTVHCAMVNRIEWSCCPEPTNQQNVANAASYSENYKPQKNVHFTPSSLFASCRYLG